MSGSDVLKALETARIDGTIRSSQQALVEVAILENRSDIKEVVGLLDKSDIEKLFVVSDIHFVDELETPLYGESSKILVVHHDGKFCARCWNFDYNAVEVEDGQFLCPRCKEVVDND